ncbi:unnamed protein product [Cylicocyclus nassatus]|uniref:Uncharacterized protein n=1 Tax=Cylicocyclus nassatus TaxID=53992 RepID=A0AA36H721_CYLNA|nr:unnamed protein product [Cylicocyclus nassatus]
MGIALYCGHNVCAMMFLSIGVFSLIFQLYAPVKISYGFLLSRIWQFMCGSIAYELSKPASSFARDRPLLPQEKEVSTRNACKQGRMNLSYEGPYARTGLINCSCTSISTPAWRCWCTAWEKRILNR